MLILYGLRIGVVVVGATLMAVRYVEPKDHKMWITFAGERGLIT